MIRLMVLQKIRWCPNFSSLRLLCVFGVSAVNSFLPQIHREDAENAEGAQRQILKLGHK
jgi:hypothetical protein